MWTLQFFIWDNYVLCAYSHLETEQNYFIGRFRLVYIVHGWLLAMSLSVPIRHKHEIVDVFLNWKMIETQIGRKIKQLRTDNAASTNRTLTKLCQNEGIIRYFTVWEIPQQNGVVERMNRTLLETCDVRCIMLGWATNFGLRLLSYMSHLTKCC